MKTTIIAELGSCHDGDLFRLLDMVEHAAVCGATAVKLQWISSAERLVERRKAPEYLDAYRLIAHPIDWLYRARMLASERGVKFLCTVYLPEDVEKIAPHVDGIKIASFEAEDDTLFGLARATGQPIYISTGMLDALTTALLAKQLRDGDTIFYCVSSYPTPLIEANMKAIKQLRAFAAAGVHVGWSDHTPPDITVSGAIARAYGADTVEVHVRHNFTDPSNRDRAVARSWAQFRQYVANIKATEALIAGTGVKHVQDAERPMMRYRATGV